MTTKKQSRARVAAQAEERKKSEAATGKAALLRAQLARERGLSEAKAAIEDRKARRNGVH